MLGILAITALLAQLMNLPGIVGTFLAGLAVNEAVKDKPAKRQAGIHGQYPVHTDLLHRDRVSDRPVRAGPGVTEDFSAAAGIIGALVAGKWIAAEVAGRTFGYVPAARRTVWSLTLPQVAATLAATLVAYRTFNAAGAPLLDGRMLNAVLVMVLFTAILGPLLTQRFAPGMPGQTPHPPANGNTPA